MRQPERATTSIHVALACAALLCIVPSLVPVHTLPIPSFYEEWIAALLACATCSALLWIGRRGELRFPATVFPLLAFALVLVVQIALAKIAYTEQATLALLYVLLTTAMIWSGAQLRDAVGVERAAQVVASGLVVAGALSALICLVQAYLPAGQFFSPLIVPLESPRVFGNLGQPNLLADQLMLAGASLLYLWASGTIQISVALPLGALFVAGLSLSGSRTVWLCGAALLLWTLFNRTRSPDHRTFGRIGSALGGALVLLALAPWLLPPVDADGFAATSASAFERLAAMRLDAQSGGLDGMRSYFWRHAIDVAQQVPLLGAGIGQFAFSFLQWPPDAQPLDLYCVERNAHNVVLHLLAETGIAGLVCLLVALGLWTVRILRTPADLTRWWIVAAVGVMLLHSQLEYPLWYAHFLAPFALLLGLGETTHWSMRYQRLARITATGVLALGAVMLASLLHGYDELRRWVYLASESSLQDAAFVMRQREAIRRVRATLLAPYVDLPLAGTLPVDAVDLHEKLAFNERAMQFAPIPPIVLRHVVYLTLAARHDEARQWLAAAARFYPRELPAFAADLERLRARGLAMDDLARSLSKVVHAGAHPLTAPRKE